MKVVMLTLHSLVFSIVVKVDATLHLLDVHGVLVHAVLQYDLLEVKQRLLMYRLKRDGFTRSNVCTKRWVNIIIR